ncbi:MAG: hypothetical protein V1681_11370 [Candidatus Neomarinimicrobiota bacterium]
MSKKIFKLDERQQAIIRRIIAALYLFTIIYLAVAILYREHFLGQTSREFDDIAILLVINVFVLIGAVLNFGGITFNKFKPLVILGVYLTWVVLGTLSTIFIRHLTNWSIILNKIGIITAICGSFTIIYVLIAYFSKRRIDKRIE